MPPYSTPKVSCTQRGCSCKDEISDTIKTGNEFLRLDARRHIFRMKRTTLQGKGILGAASIAIIVFAFALSASVAIGASTAEAQSTRTGTQDVSATFLVDSREPRDPQPPFGYGGGPRAPRDTVGLGDVFDRFREFILRLFR